MWAAPAPWTVFQGVRSVEPGSAVCVRADGTLRKHSYWRPAMACERPGDGWSGSLEEAADELEGRLTRSIALRLRADVPVGAYLSGGLDSSVIAQLVRRVSGDALHTFSLRFDDPAFDESSAQRTMSTLLGTAHHDIVVGPGDISEAIPEVVWHCETPLLRTGPAPMFLLSGLVQRHGIKVVLTGEGADEFFAGYDLFKEDRVRRFWARRPESSMRPALLSRVHPYVVGAAHTGAMWEEYFRNGLSDTGAPFYSHRLRWEAAAWGLRFLVPEARAGVSEIGSDVERLLPRGWRGWPALSRAQGIEVATFLSAYLLSSQGDRVAMGHGVETRFPFLDPGVMDFSARLPSRMKMSGLRDKLVLRKVASGPGVNLPTEVSRRRKWPYRAPIAGALFGAQPPDYVRELLSARSLAESGVIDARVAGAFADRFVGKAGRMGEREEMALVGLLTLQLLHRSMIHGVASKIDDAEGRIEGVVPDVFEDRRSK